MRSHVFTQQKYYILQDGISPYRLGTLIVIAMAFVLYRLMRRLLIILAVSPAMGGFSIVMALVALWRAFVAFNPLLQSLLRGGE